MRMSPRWPFEDAPNTTSITTVHVLNGTLPILLVTHDADDGTWQFLCGTTDDPDEGRVVGLDCIVGLDPTVADLADLPLGWRAWRDAPGEPWTREPRAETE
jgi:hypothetical protein